MMNKFKRIFVIVADSLGVGASDDASKYNDEGSNTLRHLSYAKKDFSIPSLYKLGIGNITDINNTPFNKDHIASLRPDLKLENINTDDFQSRLKF